ncbi:MAG: glycosyltransferase family 4 protein [Candidatus Ranarchaeia archaeon]
MGRSPLIPSRIGAVYKHSDALARILARRGHKVVFVNTEYTGKEACVEYLQGDYDYHRGYPFHPSKSFIEKVISSSPDYDIIHHFGTEGFTYEVLRHQGKFQNGPVAPSICSLWTSRTAPLKLSSKWRLLLKGKIFRYLAAREEGVAARLADVVTVTSSAMQEQVHKEHNLPFEKIHVIPRGTDISFFSEPTDAIESPTKGPMILTAARLDPEKGIGRLIHAMPYILEQIPDAYLYVVGDGPHRADFLRLIASLGLEAHIGLPGKVSKTELRRYYAGCSVFVLCSIFEAFGAVIIEAACAGKPAVVSDRGGPKDIVVQGETGLHVNPEDPKEIAKTITWLLRRPVLLETMGEKARKRVFREYSFDKEAERYEKLYNNFIRKEVLNL